MIVSKFECFLLLFIFPHFWFGIPFLLPFVLSLSSESSLLLWIPSSRLRCGIPVLSSELSFLFRGFSSQQCHALSRIIPSSRLYCYVFLSFFPFFCALFLNVCRFVITFATVDGFCVNSVTAIVCCWNAVILDGHNGSFGDV